MIAYLTSHITKANVESFIEKNASSWGHKNIRIQLSWRYRIPIEANVVAITMNSASSEIGILYSSENQALSSRKSPPLAIPLADLADMQTAYSRYVEDIVRNDLDHYVSTAYQWVYESSPSKLLLHLFKRELCSGTDVGCAHSYQKSDFSVELLKVISTFYTNYQCDLLRQALEIHVACTILERSLLLDEESRDLVQNHLGEELPPNAGPRCAQRQIKLAFFIVQKERIKKVLKEWGAMMWTSNKNINNERKWATSLSVFLALCLIMDKTLGAVSLMCSHKIKNQGYDAHSERSEYRRIVRLTETELFERCKEILHSNFKTRKAGKESFNPIRDGDGKVADGNIAAFVRDLQTLIRIFGTFHFSTKNGVLSETNYIRTRSQISQNLYARRDSRYHGLHGLRAPGLYFPRRFFGALMTGQY